MRSGFDEMRIRCAWMFTPQACVEANRPSPQDTIPRRRAGGLHALSLRGAIATKQSRALTPRWIAWLALAMTSRPQSKWICAALATAVYLAMSRAMRSRKEAPLLPSGMRPSCVMRAATSGSLAIAMISVSSLLTIGSGVPLGAARPMKPSTTTPSMPTSASVGTSGSAGRRVAPVVASGRSLPALNSGIADLGKADETFHDHAVDADLGKRRNVRQRGQARRAGGGERPQLAGLEQRHRRPGIGECRRRLPRDDGGDQFGAALERDVLEFRTGLFVEQLRGELEDGGRGGIVGLVGVGLAPGDELLDRFDRQRFRHRQHELIKRHVADQVVALERIVRQVRVGGRI